MNDSFADDGDSVTTARQEVLTFRVADAVLGFPVTSLCEVIQLVDIVRVENHGLAEGIINYRGTVIPIVDTRKALGFPPVQYGLDANIIITDVADVRTGLVVDLVLDVLSIPEQAIERPGPMVPLKEHVASIAKLDDRLLLILSIEQILKKPRRAAPVAPAGLTGALDEPTRQILVRRAQELSKPVGEAELESVDAVTFVCFTVGVSPYALSTRYAKEIVLPPRIARIPCTPEFVLGAINIRGVIMPVLSLAMFLGCRQKSDPGQEQHRIIVTEIDDVVVGFYVNQVLGIAAVSTQDVLPPLVTIETGIIRFIEGEFDHEGKAICAIDAPAIVTALEKLDMTPAP